ncbi:MAG: penicillin-binding protein 2 [Magnetococcales bacterium]|nr:penicillin-binding protein 2 [Magnetococcales bacterium]
MTSQRRTPGGKKSTASSRKPARSTKQQPKARGQSQRSTYQGGRSSAKGSTRKPTTSRKLGTVAKPGKGYELPRGRLEFITGLFVLAFVILAVRAVDLTVLQGSMLHDKASTQHRKKVILPAFRGQFLDRNGRTLAVSLPVKTLSVDRDMVEDPYDLADQLAPLIGVSKKRLGKRLARARPGTFPLLKRKVSPETARRIQELDHPALFFIPAAQRFYTMGEITSHVLGFVNIDGKGVEGLERVFDGDLQGTQGLQVITRDRLGRPMPGGRTITPAKPGTDIVLSIDTTIQYIAYRALLKAVRKSQAKGGMVVILDPTDGNILALVNQPGFNPNNLSASTAKDRRNRAVTDAFEPGSTFKIFTVAAALDMGKVTPDKIIDVENGRFRVGDRIIRDFHREKRWLTVGQVLQKSSNVGAAKIGLMVGNQELEDYIFKFGFGRETGVELGAEARGRIPDIRHYWQVGLANRSYGYGITATPLQLVRAATAAVNGGLLHAPRLVVGKVDGEEIIPTPFAPSERVISAKTSRQLRKILTTVVGTEGTAPQAAVEGYSVAGKTGTARKASSKGGYAEGLYFSSFLGFVPNEKPRIVIFIGIDEPEGKYYGGQVAAPVFREIAQEVMPLLAVMPEKTKKPMLPPEFPKGGRQKETGSEEAGPLYQATLGEALEKLYAQGEVPLVKGSGLVVRQERTEDNQLRLVLK